MPLFDVTVSAVPGPRLPMNIQNIRFELTELYARSINLLDSKKVLSLLDTEVRYTSQALPDELHGRDHVVEYINKKYDAIRSSNHDTWTQIGVVDHPLAASIPCVIANNGLVRQCLFVLHPNNFCLIDHIEILTVAPHPNTARVMP